MKKKLYYLGIFFLFYLCISTPYLFAQGAGDGGDGTPTDPDAAIPIDGGVGFLAAGGIAYGIKKIRDYNKRK